MAITPPSDIVLDVARAADPERYRAAAERLARFRSTSSETTPPGATARDVTAARQPNTSDAPAITDRSPDTGAPVRHRGRLDPYGQFESFVLQSFIQAMLPKNATNVFGKGSAGEFWKSMLAEKMGDELARSGQVGIARRLSVGARPTSSLGSNTAAPLTPPPSLMSTLPYIQQRPPDAAEGVDVPANTSIPIAERS